MTDRYEKIRKARKALEDLRERCAREAERRRTTMTDRYEKIRRALEMGPTPGPWGFTELPRDMQRDGYKFAISRRGIGWRFAQIAHGMDSMANATYVTACDPDTIRELLAERDALAAALEAAREDATPPATSPVRILIDAIESEIRQLEGKADWKSQAARIASLRAAIDQAMRE